MTWKRYIDKEKDRRRRTADSEGISSEILVIPAAYAVSKIFLDFIFRVVAIEYDGVPLAGCL